MREGQKNPSRYWLPLICLFQVCRREEAGQLALVDIQEDNGIPYIRINDDEKLGQSLKNEGSRRKVPIHSSLIRLGFLEFVKKCKNAGQVRLFPQLTKGNNGYGDAVGKWFGRLKIKYVERGDFERANGRVGLTDFSADFRDVPLRARLP
jgi:integrase